MEQLALQPDAPWYIAYRFEALVVVGSSVAGYIGSQHLKTAQEHLSALTYAGFNGLIAGTLSTWILANEYTLNQSLQGGALLALCSPAVVFLLHLILDRIFPGKLPAFKCGIYVDKPTLKNMAKAAIVGKRKDRRRGPRIPPDDDITRPR